MKRFSDKFSFILLIITVTSSFLFISSMASIKSQTSPTPKGIRLTIINDPTNSAVISWYTESPATSPIVYYDTESSLATPLQKTATQKTIDSTYIYTVELTDLTANTTYFYKIMTDTTTYNFTTAAGRDMDNVQFLVLGDTQSLKEVTWNLTAQSMEKFGDDIDFVLHMGDIVNTGTDQEEFNTYFDNMESIHAYKPCFFTEGNHEDGLLTKMYDNIPLPSNGMSSRYYSFNWGPASFVSLNNNDAEFWPHTKMPLIWLEREMSNFDLDKYTLWKFAYFHQPMFNSKLSRTDKYELIPTWLPILDNHGVDIVFTGHNHFYERTYPMNHLGQINTSETTNFIDPESPIYITCNADNKLYDYFENPGDPLPDYVYYHNKTRQVSYVNISVNVPGGISTLSYESWAIPAFPNGSFGELVLIDAFTITKALPDKYTNPAYTTPTLVSHIRMPEFVYFIMYFAILGVLIVVVNYKSLKRYFKYKKPKVRDYIISTEINKRTTKKKPFMRSASSFIIFIGASIALALLFNEIELTGEEIIDYALGPLGALLIMIPINYVLGGKYKGMNTLSHILFYLGLALIIAVIVLFNGTFYYLIYSNLILLGVGLGAMYSANHLSKNFKESKISHKESFYLGGTLIFFGVLLAWYAAMNLIAQF